MKRINLALFVLLLNSSAAFGGVDKKIVAPTKSSDTTQFIRYFAFALATAATGFGNFYYGELLKNLTSDSLVDKLWLYFAVAPLILSKNDAKTAWNYYQKAFPPKNKLEQSSQKSEEAKELPTKKMQIIKLLGYSGFAAINMTATAVAAFLYLKEKENKDISVPIHLLLNLQVFYRLAASNINSIQEINNKETTHETV